MNLLLGVASVFAFGFLLAGQSLGSSGHRTHVSINYPRIPGTMIACYESKQHRWMSKTRPANCVIAGYKGLHGQQFRSTPVEGMKWEEWGRFRGYGELGSNVRTNIPVRVIAFRRIKCGDGRTFYSSASVVNLEDGSYYAVRLPICDSPKPRRN